MAPLVEELRLIQASNGSDPFNEKDTGSGDRNMDIISDISGRSVTRLDNLLHFGQLFKACGDNYFAQITHILGNYCLKSLTFLVESFLGNFYRHLVTFTGHTDFNLLVQKLCFVPRHLLLSFYSTFFISILSHSSRPKVNIIVLIDFCSRLTFCLYKFRINS